MWKNPPWHVMMKSHFWRISLTSYILVSRVKDETETFCPKTETSLFFFFPFQHIIMTSSVSKNRTLLMNSHFSATFIHDRLPLWRAEKPVWRLRWPVGDACWGMWRSFRSMWSALGRGSGPRARVATGPELDAHRREETKRMPRAWRQTLGGKGKGDILPTIPSALATWAPFPQKTVWQKKRIVLSPLIIHHPWRDQLLLKQPRSPFSLPVWHLWDPWRFRGRCQAVTKDWWLSQDTHTRPHCQSEPSRLLTAGCTVTLKLRLWDFERP